MHAFRLVPPEPAEPPLPHPICHSQAREQATHMSSRIDARIWGEDTSIQIILRTTH